MERVVIAGIGHRPDKLGGFDFYNANGLTRLTDLAEAAIKHYQPVKIISGMAVGWDTGLALAALNTSIPFISVIPFEGFELSWTTRQQKIYRNLLEKAEEVVVISNDPNKPLAFQEKDQFLVDWCDSIWALWDGKKGETANAIRYARFKKRPIVNLWDSWVKYK